HFYGAECPLNGPFTNKLLRAIGTDYYLQTVDGEVVLQPKATDKTGAQKQRWTLTASGVLQNAAMQKIDFGPHDNLVVRDPPQYTFEAVNGVLYMIPKNEDLERGVVVTTDAELGSVIGALPLRWWSEGE